MWLEHHGNRLYGFMGLLSKKWEWTGVDNVMTTRAPAVRKCVFWPLSQESILPPKIYWTVQKFLQRDNGNFFGLIRASPTRISLGCTSE